MELHEITRRSRRKGSTAARLKMFYHLEFKEMRQAREIEKRPMKKGES